MQVVQSLVMVVSSKEGQNKLDLAKTKQKSFQRNSFLRTRM